MKTLKQVFPPALIGMFLFTQLVAVGLNFDLFDSRELIILFCWIPLLTVPALLVSKRWVYILVLGLCFLESFLGLLHWVILSGPLTASSLFVIANTNFSEANDFLVLKFTPYFFLLAPYLVLFYLALRRKPDAVIYPKRMFWVVPILLFSVLFIGENLANERLVRKGIPQSAKAIVSFVEEANAYAALKKRTVQEVKTWTSNGTDTSRVFVLIIGESGNRSHHSLYGYQRNTNPRLGKRTDIIAFKNVVSGYSNTLTSVLAAMTEANLENGKSVDNSISLIDVFHSAGYKTCWLSNQSPIGIWDNGVYNLAQTADVVNFVNRNANSSVENIHLRSYDEKLLQPLRQLLIENTKNKFIVLHLMGSHAGYAKRYPSNFEVFQDVSSTEKQLISEYDNSVLYTDFIVDSVFNLLEQYAKTHAKSSCTAIYLADHGENVYDEEGKVGHDYAGSLPKANVEIPFILWTSSQFDLRNPGRIAGLKAKAAAPFVSDDLFHAVLDLNEIECTNYEKSRSLFNVSFNASRTRVLEDGKNYDLK